MSNADRIEELRSKYEENPRRYFAPLANEFRKAGDLAQAIAICREHLPKQPGHMSGYIVFGQTLYESGSMDEARTVFEQALSLDPENLIALKHLGDIARTKGENSVARRWYERVLDADPRNDEIAAQLASLSTPTPPIALPVAPPAPAPRPNDSTVLEDASGVFRSFDPNSLLDVPEDVIAGVSSQSEWAPRPTSTPRPTPTHEPIDLDFPEESEPTAAAEQEFEEGLNAPEWPETADLIARTTTPFRASTPISVPVTPEAVAAFGREVHEEFEAPKAADMVADIELDDSFVDAYMPPVTATPEPIELAELVEPESLPPVAQPVAATPIATPPVATPLHLLFDEAEEAFAESALNNAIEEPVSHALEFSDAQPVEFDSAIPQLDELTLHTMSDAHATVEDESVSLLDEPFEPVAPAHDFAAIEGLGESDAEPLFAPETSEHSVEDEDTHFAFAVPAAVRVDAPQVSDEESFAAINPESPQSIETSDELFNDPEESDAFAYNPILRSAFAPLVEQESVATVSELFEAPNVDEHERMATPTPTNAFPDYSFDLPDADMAALAATADEDDTQSEMLVASATADNVHEEELLPVAAQMAPHDSDEPSPAFVTETMAELLVSQGFVPRAIEIYQELVRRHPHDSGLASRLNELHAQEAGQTQVEHAAEQQLVNDFSLDDADEELLPQDTAYYASDAGHVQSFASAVPAPRFATPVRSTPLYFTPISNTPVATPAVAEPVVAAVAKPTPAWNERAVAYRTAREQFAELARRRVSRRTPVHATAIAEDSGEGLSTLFGSAAPTTPDELAARALADAFGPVQDSGESLFDVPDTAAPVAPLRSFTPRSTSSIQANAGAPSESRTERPSNSDYSFDRFFPDPAMSSNGSASTTTFPHAAPGTTPPANEDLAQFSAWLKGLNNA